MKKLIALSLLMAIMLPACASKRWDEFRNSELVPTTGDVAQVSADLVLTNNALQAEIDLKADQTDFQGLESDHIALSNLWKNTDTDFQTLETSVGNSSNDWNSTAATVGVWSNNWNQTWASVGNSSSVWNSVEGKMDATNGAAFNPLLTWSFGGATVALTNKAAGDLVLTGDGSFTLDVDAVDFGTAELYSGGVALDNRNYNVAHYAPISITNDLTTVSNLAAGAVDTIIINDTTNTPTGGVVDLGTVSGGGGSDWYVSSDQAYMDVGTNRVWIFGSTAPIDETYSSGQWTITTTNATLAIGAYTVEVRP